MAYRRAERRSPSKGKGYGGPGSRSASKQRAGRAGAAHRERVRRGGLVGDAKAASKARADREAGVDINTGKALAPKEPAVVKPKAPKTIKAVTTGFAPMGGWATYGMDAKAFDESLGKGSEELRREQRLSQHERDVLKDSEEKAARYEKQNWFENATDYISESFNDIFGDDDGLDYSDAEVARIKAKAGGVSSARIDQLARETGKAEASQLASDIAGESVGGIKGKLAGKALGKLAGTTATSGYEKQFVSDLRDAVDDSQLSGISKTIIGTASTMLTGNPLLGKFATTGYDTYALNDTISDALSEEAKEQLKTDTQKALDAGREGQAEKTKIDMSSVINANIPQPQAYAPQYQLAPRPVIIPPMQEDPMGTYYAQMYGNVSMYG